MAPITGRQSKIGIDVHAAAGFGTATAVTKAIAVENLDPAKNPAKLFSSPIGRAESMYSAMEQGAIDPQPSFSAKVGYNNGIPELLATFFGTSAAPAEQTVGQGDYLHVIKLNETRLAYFFTMAMQATSSEIFEFPDCAISDLVLNYAGPFPNYVVADFTCLANNRVDAAASQVNTFAGLTALAAPNRDEIVARDTSLGFRLNSDSGGALANGDVKPITGATIQFTDALRRISEMKNAAGLSKPVPEDVFLGTLTVNFRDLTDFTYYTALGAGTTYKGSVTVTGNQIGTGVNQKFEVAMPYLKIVQDPQFTYANPGINEHIVTFDMLARTATPTGMADKYPHINLINNLSTSLLA